jgi:hypothetical protein
MELDFFIDDKKHVEIVKGEDRSLVIRVVEKDSNKPVSLVGADVSFELTRTDGLKLSRSTAAKALASVDAVNDTLGLVDHGYANGDVVQLTTTGTLPGGLSLLTNYYVVEAASETFKLSSTLGGAAIDLTTSGSGVHSVSGVGVSVSSPANLGEVTVTLHDLVTAELLAGVFQTAELSYVISGATRIVQLKRAVSVMAQAA